MTIRTRFSPAPTGYLHLGNARAALFGALFALSWNGVRGSLPRCADLIRKRRCRSRGLPILLPRLVRNRFTALLDVFARTFHGVATCKRAKQARDEQGCH